MSNFSFEETNYACSAGVIHAGTANNVVPRRAALRGTLRTFTPDQRTSALGSLESLLERTRWQFSVRAELIVDHYTPMVVNDPHVTERAEAAARQVVGGGAVIRIPPASPSDDVSEFLNRRPGCYFFVGGALADGTSGMHHCGQFAVDDGALRVMAGVLANAAVDLAQPTTAR